MSVIAYSRISTDQQDLEKQKHLLLQYAQKQGWLINEFIEVSISSRKNTKQRKIDELLETLRRITQEISIGRYSGICNCNI